MTQSILTHTATIRVLADMVLHPYRYELKEMGEALRRARDMREEAWQATGAMQTVDRWNHKRLNFDVIPQRLWQLPNDGPVETWKYEWRDLG